METVSTNIIFEEMKFFAYHGVLPQESIVGAVYKVNLNIKVDFSDAAENDNLDMTINYAEVHNLVKEEMSHPSKLLEHVSYKICKRLFTEFPSIETIEISVYKENPPMGAECKNVGVKAVFRR